LPIVYDVSSSVEVTRAAREIGERLDHRPVVNNAGIGDSSRFADHAPALDHMIESISPGPIVACGAADDGRQKVGRVVNTPRSPASVAISSATPLHRGKAGLIGLTKPRRWAAPHSVWSTRSRSGLSIPTGENERSTGRDHGAHPLGRFAAIEEIAAVVLFLLSDASGYIVSETINVNGGRTGLAGVSDAKTKAVLESMHWHVPCTRSAAGPGIEVVGCPTAPAAWARARKSPRLPKLRHGGSAPARNGRLRVCLRPSCRHAGTRDDAHWRGIPFAIEKPYGVRAADEQLADAARARAVCRGTLHSPDQRCDQIAAIAATSEVEHANFRFIGGPPDRYIAMGTPWMLEGVVGRRRIVSLDSFRRPVPVPAGSDSCRFRPRTSRISKLSIEDEISVQADHGGGPDRFRRGSYTPPEDRLRSRARLFGEDDGCLPEHWPTASPCGDWRPMVIGRRWCRRDEIDLTTRNLSRRRLPLAGRVAPFAGLRDAARAGVVGQHLSAGMGGTPVAPEGRAWLFSPSMAVRPTARDDAPASAMRPRNEVNPSFE
jgi:3-oxoacyl-[acyl-carrier protein] reductase